ncbi:MAG: sugar kinase, partial [Euryarchaeota archaeon]|nr:sugar kinase [Euryarchaeota archaeon]
MGPAPPHVLALGEALIDFIATRPGPPGKVPGFVKMAGGAPANLCVGLARLGARAALVTRVGRDPFGVFLRDTLAREGVDTRWVRDSPRPTGLAFVFLGRGGERSFHFCRDNSADFDLRPGDLPRSFRGVRVFHFGGAALMSPGLRETLWVGLARARRAGCIVSFDPNLRPGLAYSVRKSVSPSERRDHPVPRGALRRAVGGSDLLFVTGEEARVLASRRDSRRAAEALHRGCATVCLKRGARGSTVYHREGVFRIPAFRVHPVDTTGAGDGYAAGYIYGLLRGWGPGR